MKGAAQVTGAALLIRGSEGQRKGSLLFALAAAAVAVSAAELLGAAAVVADSTAAVAVAVAAAGLGRCRPHRAESPMLLPRKTADEAGGLPV